MRELPLPRIELGDPEATVRALCEVHAALDDVMSSGGGVLALDVPFAAPFGYAFLEAERLRSAGRGVTIELRAAPNPAYSKPFGDVIGFGGNGSGSATTIPIRQFTGAGGPGTLLFLVEWSEKAQRLTAVDVGDVVETVGELFDNGLTHARSPVGVVACGQFYPKIKTLHLSIVDLGIGIPASIAESAGRREDEIDPAAALRWAFEEGHSSRETSRGLGLARVQEFVARTGATLYVFSGAGLATLRGASWQARRMPARLPGTMIDLELPTAQE